MALARSIDKVIEEVMQKKSFSTSFNAPKTSRSNKRDKAIDEGIMSEVLDKLMQGVLVTRTIRSEHSTMGNITSTTALSNLKASVEKASVDIPDLSHSPIKKVATSEEEAQSFGPPKKAINESVWMAPATTFQVGLLVMNLMGTEQFNGKIVLVDSKQEPIHLHRHLLNYPLILRLRRRAITCPPPCRENSMLELSRSE